MKEGDLQIDLHLWNEFVKGSNEALRVIYTVHVQSLYRFGCQFTKDDALIEDCIQDVFVDLQHYRSRLSATDNIRNYLFVAFRRKITKELKKKQYLRQSLNEELPFVYDIPSDDEEDDLSVNRIKILKRELSKLTPRQREAIYLRFVCELSYEELENVLDLNYQSVRNLIYLGLERLRKNCSESLLLYWLCFLPLVRKKTFFEKKVKYF